jgi:hypothetical protein
MRRIFKFSVLGLAAGAIVACRPDEVIPTENIPTAGVRFINAVPDTMPLDFRFVDIVESNAHFRIAFRNSPCSSGGVTSSCQVQYKNARAGSRRFRIFLNDTVQAVASTQIVPEGTFTFNAGSNYTALLWGWASPADATVPRQPGSPAMTLDIFEETVPDPGTQVALRVINATRGAIDVRTFPCTDPPGLPNNPCSGTIPGAPAAAFTNIAAKTVSAYVTVNPDTTVFNVRPAGGGAGSELVSDTIAAPGAIRGVKALIGIPANSSGARNPVNNQLLPCIGPAEPQPAPPAAPILKCDIEAAPGTTIAGSAVTAIVFPGSTACSRAPQVSPFQFTTGSIANLGASATGYTRVGGSFVSDGFLVGQTIGVCGFHQAANNGLHTITGVTATTLTVTGGNVLEAGTPAGAAGVYSATTTGYARNTGSFVTDGFVTGMTIRVTGFTKPENNGLATVGAVTATTMAVTKTPATAVEPAAVTASFGATATGYTRSAGDFVAEGWVPGHNITASGFVNAANNGASLILAVTPTTLTVNKSGGTVAEVELPARTLATTAVRSFGNAILRQIAAERPFITFVWDRRPPRPLGM